MTDADNMTELAALAPDFFGLIFYEKSPRFVTVEQARNLPEFSDIGRIGVFVNETAEIIRETAQQTNLSLIQLHGGESPEFCEKLRDSDLHLIKAFAVDENFDFTLLQKYESVCDYFLFDTKTKIHGGSGKTFDWNILQKLESDKLFFLGGGIGAENAAEAIEKCQNLPLFALDVNSRAETAPGIKSVKIVEEIRVICP